MSAKWEISFIDKKLQWTEDFDELDEFECLLSFRCDYYDESENEFTWNGWEKNKNKNKPNLLTKSTRCHIIIIRAERRRIEASGDCRNRLWTRSQKFYISQTNQSQ